MYNCPKCGAENKKDAKFCSDCGLSLGYEDVPTEIKALTSGTILANRYEVIKRIKSGGMGSVYKTKHATLGKIYAIKELLSISMDPREQTEAVERFEREAKILSDLSHPNMPSVSDYFSIGGRYYLVMDFIEGNDLSTILAEQGQPGLPEDLTIEWCVQICEVLNYLHTRNPPIIYRDIKPSNIMIRKSDNKAILIDFGIARTVQPEEDHSITKTTIGTMGYMSPEQYRGRPELRSDIYSLGATMYHLLTGNQPIPFTFPSLNKERPDISEKTNAVVMTSLRLKPQERFQSAQEMKNALMGQVKVSMPLTEEPDKIDLMILQLNIPDSNIRKFAIKTLGELNDTKAVKPLLNIINKDGDWQIRKISIEIIGKFPFDQKIEDMLKDRLLNDENPQVRATAAQIMGVYLNETFSGPLILAINDSSDEVRLRSIITLGKMKEKRALKALNEIIISEKNETIKEEAVLAIENINPAYIDEWRAIENEEIRKKQSQKTIFSIVTITVLLIISILLIKFLSITYKEQKIKDCIKKGFYYITLQKDNQAREMFNQAINLSVEKNAMALYGLGLTYMEENPDKSIDSLKQAIKINQNIPYPYFYLGKMFFRKKNYPEAITNLEKAKEMLPEHSDIYITLIEVYYSSGQVNKAKEILNLYTMKFPENLNDERIRTLNSLFDKTQNTSTTISNKGEKQLLNKGIEYINSQQYDKAIQCYEEATRINPLSSEAYYGLGLSYMDLDKEKAKSYLQKAIQCNINYIEAYISLSELLFTLNEYNQTIEWSNKGLAIYPNTPKLQLLLGLSYYSLGNKSECVTPLKKYLELEPNGKNTYTVKKILEQLNK